MSHWTTLGLALRLPSVAELPSGRDSGPGCCETAERRSSGGNVLLTWSFPAIIQSAGRPICARRPASPAEARPHAPSSCSPPQSGCRPGSGRSSPVRYKNHREANLILDGTLEVTEYSSGDTHYLEPGGLYLVGPADRHSLEAVDDVNLISVFNPPLTGTATHDEDGAFPPPPDRLRPVRRRRQRHDIDIGNGLRSVEGAVPVPAAPGQEIFVRTTTLGLVTALVALIGLGTVHAEQEWLEMETEVLEPNVRPKHIRALHECTDLLGKFQCGSLVLQWEEVDGELVFTEHIDDNEQQKHTKDNPDFNAYCLEDTLIVSHREIENGVGNIIETISSSADAGGIVISRRVKNILITLESKLHLG